MSAPAKKNQAQQGQPAEPRHPTVAVSDAFLAGCHFYAASELWRAGLEPQAVGFSLVALAATAGVLRFGFSPATFRATNEALAGLAGAAGLPLVGAPLLVLLTGSARGLPTLALFSAFVVVHLVLRNLVGVAVTEGVQTLLNLVFFLGPLGNLGWQQGDNVLLAGLALFAVTGIVIGPDRERTLLGVRRENLFHYGLGMATLMIATRLAATSHIILSL